MYYAHQDTCVYVTDEIFEPVPIKTLSVWAHQAGRCDGCRQAYHAGEQIAIDSEARLLHWPCHVREIRFGGHLTAIPWGLR